MTQQEAIQVFIKHSQFFELYIREMYVPRACESIMDEIIGAYKVFNPSYRNDCSGCGMAMLMDCNRIRLANVPKTETTQHQFPKHKKRK
jgi:hypothetical protein